MFHSQQLVYLWFSFFSFCFYLLYLITLYGMAITFETASEKLNYSTHFFSREFYFFLVITCYLDTETLSPNLNGLLPFTVHISASYILFGKKNNGNIFTQIGNHPTIFIWLSWQNWTLLHANNKNQAEKLWYFWIKKNYICKPHFMFAKNLLYNEWCIRNVQVFVRSDYTTHNASCSAFNIL